MAALQRKVVRTLKKRFPDVVTDGLETIPATGRVTGWIASNKFRKLDDEARQNLLWKVLNKGLAPDELEDLGPIVAMSLIEAESFVADNR